MTPLCIHGFRREECAMCHTCPHGLIISRCPRCIASSTAAAARRSVALQPAPPAEQHAGYEIFYEPTVSGWHFRAPDSEPSPASYRSAFLARKAVDAVLAGHPVSAKPRRGGKRSS